VKGAYTCESFVNLKMRKELTRRSGGVKEGSPSRGICCQSLRPTRERDNSERYAVRRGKEGDIPKNKNLERELPNRTVARVAAL